MWCQCLIGNADHPQDLYLARGAELVGEPDVDKTAEVWWVPLANSLTHFAADLQRPYTCQYTFIEPNYGDITGSYRGGSSHHPMDDVYGGEGLTKAVYEAIRNSPVRDTNLLIITYDEHGGFYNSVGTARGHPARRRQPQHPQPLGLHLRPARRPRPRRRGLAVDRAAHRRPHGLRRLIRPRHHRAALRPAAPHRARRDRERRNRPVHRTAPTHQRAHQTELSGSTHAPHGDRPANGTSQPQPTHPGIRQPPRLPANPAEDRPRTLHDTPRTRRSAGQARSSNHPRRCPLLHQLRHGQSPLAKNRQPAPPLKSQTRKSIISNGPSPPRPTPTFSYQREHSPPAATFTRTKLLIK